MAEIIKIAATPNLKRRYQKLLTSQWTARTLDEVLSLLAEELASFFPSKAGNHEWTAASELSQVVVMMIQIHMKARKSVSPKALPPVPAILPSRDRTPLSSWSLKARRTWTFLVLQVLARLRGNVAFYRDCQSLLLLVAVHFLLPVLKSRHMQPEHNLLVHAMYMNIMIAWKDLPSHQYYLKSVLLDYLGDKEEARKSLLASFELTSPQDHDYLTKAQAYWSYLLDCDRYDEAKSFLLDLYRTSPASCLSEIEEMIKDLFQFLIREKAAV